MFTLNIVRLLTKGVPYLTREPTSGKLKLHRDEYSHCTRFRKKIVCSVDFGLRDPVIQKNTYRKRATFIAEHVKRAYTRCFIKSGRGLENIRAPQRIEVYEPCFCPQ